MAVLIYVQTKPNVEVFLLGFLFMCELEDGAIMLFHGFFWQFRHAAFLLKHAILRGSQEDRGQKGTLARPILL
jgi:hypothetical protein